MIGKGLAGQSRGNPRRQHPPSHARPCDARSEKRRTQHGREKGDRERDSAGQAARRMHDPSQRDHTQPSQHHRHGGEVACLVDDDRGERGAGRDAVASPQPPRSGRVAGADREDVVEEAARRIHRERPNHAHGREGTEQQHPAPSSDDARDQGEEEHEGHRPPAVDPSVGHNLRQRDGAHPQPQQRESEGGLHPKAEPAVHASSDAVHRTWARLSVARR